MFPQRRKEKLRAPSQLVQASLRMLNVKVHDSAVRRRLNQYGLTGGSLFCLKRRFTNLKPEQTTRLVEQCPNVWRYLLPDMVVEGWWSGDLPTRVFIKSTMNSMVYNMRHLMMVKTMIRRVNPPKIRKEWCAILLIFFPRYLLITSTIQIVIDNTKPIPIFITKAYMSLENQNQK